MIRTRAVRISGTDYTPPKDIYEIKIRLMEIFSQHEDYTNPLERAIFIHCNIRLYNKKCGYSDSSLPTLFVIKTFFCNLLYTYFSNSFLQ